MFLSVKEICFFCLIFFITAIALNGFSETLSKYKSVSPLISSYIVSFLLTIVLLSVYKLAKISHNQKDGFHFEVSKSKMCCGYPYMQSSNPELLKKCTEILSTPEGRANAVCDGHRIHFEYTPDSNQNWKNERIEDCNYRRHTHSNVPLGATGANVPLGATGANVPLGATGTNVPLGATGAGDAMMISESYSYGNNTSVPRFIHRLVQKNNFNEKGKYAKLVPDAYGWIKPENRINVVELHYS